jgi:hypothetical protein
MRGLTPMGRGGNTAGKQQFPFNLEPPFNDRVCHAGKN